MVKTTHWVARINLWFRIGLCDRIFCTIEILPHGCHELSQIELGMMRSVSQIGRMLLALGSTSDSDSVTESSADNLLVLFALIIEGKEVSGPVSDSAQKID
jgi:hypothetical protein